MNPDTKNYDLRKFNHIGIVVKDINKAVQYYESLGFGPFGHLQGIKVTERILYGKPAPDIRVEIRVAQAGPLPIELIQPVAGRSVWQDFLEAKGEGIHHLGIVVNDLDKEAAKLEKQGFEEVYRAKMGTGGVAAYFDTKKIGLPYFQLEQW